MPNDQSSEILERLERAEHLKLMGQHDESLALLEELLIEDPENVAALEEVADNELSLEHFDRSERAAKQAIALDAKSYTGHYILGFLRSNEEKWEDAEKELKVANLLKPNNPEILRCLGWVLFNSGKRSQGIVTLERSLNLDAGNPLTLCDLGVTYLQAHNIPKAKTLFERAMELDPDNRRAKECADVVARLERAKTTVTVERPVES